MKEGRASTTAQMVALFRGLASLPTAPFHGIDDPTAAKLLSGPFGLVLRATRRMPSAFPIARALSIGLVDHVALRTAAIDAGLRDALRVGARQLVILGAGLDGRAQRMPELSDVDVFEIDHPATQAKKREAVAAHTRSEKSVRWVAIDFERDSLAAKLHEAGHRTETPTAWIWEGVTPYLAAEATRETLDVLAARSAPESTLLASYLTPALVRAAGIVRPALRAGFRALNEPITGAMSSEAMHDLLRARFFEVESDTGSPEWATRFMGSKPSRFVIDERLVIATRRTASGSPLTQ